MILCPGRTKRIFSKNVFFFRLLMPIFMMPKSMGMGISQKNANMVKKNIFIMCIASTCSQIVSCH